MKCVFECECEYEYEYECECECECYLLLGTNLFPISAPRTLPKKFKWLSAFLVAMAMWFIGPSLKFGVE